MIGIFSKSCLLLLHFNYYLFYKVIRNGKNKGFTEYYATLFIRKALDDRSMHWEQKDWDIGTKKHKGIILLFFF